MTWRFGKRFSFLFGRCRQAYPKPEEDIGKVEGFRQIGIEALQSFFFTWNGIGKPAEPRVLVSDITEEGDAVHLILLHEEVVLVSHHLL